MTTQTLKPFEPIFNKRKRFGTVSVGNTPPYTPPPPPEYDDVLLNDVGAMWYSTLGAISAPNWPDLATAIATDVGSEAVRGRIYFAHWYIESGFAPGGVNNYDATVPHLEPIWYSTVDDTGAIAWPSLSTVMAGNLASESEQGRIWFDAWFLESGNAPATYRDNVDETDPIWFSPLDELN